MYKDTLRKKKDDSFIVKNYESNLKLSYDSIRKDYDIILTSIIPTQKNLIKTYLWLNTFILGICFFFVKEKLITTLDLITLSVTLLLCVVSIGFLLFALYHNKEKQFIYFEPKNIANIKNDKWSYAQGLVNLMEDTKKAFDFNSDIVKFRSFFIRWGGASLFLAFLFFAFSTFHISYNYFSTTYRKEVKNMADDKPPVESDGNDTTKMFLSTNNQVKANTESLNERVEIRKSGSFSITSSEKPKPSSDTNATDKKDKK
ncbi:hypothetical protein YZ82_02980 [Campylobacter hyointestinalis]|uniref:Uncharacterized protein n=1 Tax=Campylobacter hyointestinalis TaxID=198 RepID=A0A562XJ13_CAMHY|nr:hypothetical protein [Campylobacter hyointestinalis]TWO21965.1 hypothetical protein YZ82_02980 [Campylobacter hyointestinalis]